MRFKTIRNYHPLPDTRDQAEMIQEALRFNQQVEYPWVQFSGPHEESLINLETNEVRILSWKSRKQAAVLAVVTLKSKATGEARTLKLPVMSRRHMWIEEEQERLNGRWREAQELKRWAA